MQWLAVNWYIVIAVVTALLLGWGVGVWYGTSKGYAAAQEEQRHLKAQMQWSNYFKQINKDIINKTKRS